MLPDWYNEYKKIIDESINKYLIDYFKEQKNEWLDLIKEASLYSVKWWKRIRSILALEFYLIFSWKKIEEIRFWDNIIFYCISIELLHAYSLIHDDLPCMDNDDLRRWELTVWKKYWENCATLAWDLLNSLSFETLSVIRNPILIKYFWQVVWLNWMVWGQVLDLYYEKYPEKLTLDNLIEVHNKKTGALIEVSVLGSLIIAEKDISFVKDEETNDIKKYLDFWKKIWLAFQVKDDLLDIEWTVEETGKSIWWEKKWFIHFMWVDKSKKYLKILISDSLNIISILNSDKLIFLVSYIWNRNK